LASINLLGLEFHVGSLPEPVELRTIDVPDVRSKYVVVGDHGFWSTQTARKVVQIIN
jgi:hypothetical protein